MAFCKQCGAEVGNEQFCGKCGAPVNGEVSNAPVLDARQRSLADMENMRRYFGAKKAQYDEYDAVSAEVKERRAYSSIGWIAGIVICAVIGLFWPVAFLGVAACIVFLVLRKKQNKEKLAVAMKREEELATELKQYFQAYGYCPVGFEYTKPAALDALYEIISIGRASNPGDAINLLISDENTREMRRLQEEATEAAKETAKYTKKAAKSSKRAAGYAAADFWLK